MNGDAATAWGVALTDGGVTMVRAVRHPDGVRIDQAEHLDLAPSDGPARAAAAVEAIRNRRGAAIPREEPVGIGVPDMTTLYRRLALPDADDATTARMVDAQVELIVPGRSADFAAGWRRLTANGAVGVCTLRRDLLEAITDAVPTLAEGRVSVVANGAALAAARSVLWGEATEAGWVIDIGHDAATLIAVRGTDVLAMSVVDAMPGPDDPAGTTAWVQQIHETLDAWREEDETDDAAAALVVGMPDAMAAAVPVLSGGLPLPVRPAALHPALALPEGVAPASVMACRHAAAAAIGLLDTTVDTIRFPLGGDVDRSRATRRRRHLVAALGWLLLIVVGWYGLDVAGGQRLASLAMGDAAARADQKNQLRDAVAIASLVHQGGPMPLAVLDELSRILPDGFTLSSMNFARGGHLQLKGVAPDPEKWHACLSALTASKAFAHVDPVRQKTVGKQKKKIEFEVIATLSRWRGAVRPKAEVAEAPPSEGNPSDPAPSTEAESDDATSETAADTADASAPAETAPAPPADSATVADEATAPAAADAPVEVQVTPDAATEEEIRRRVRIRRRAERSGGGSESNRRRRERSNRNRREGGERNER